MLFLLLRILFGVCFAHLLRYSQVRTRRPLGAAAVNYFIAAVACGVWVWLAGWRWQPVAALLGTVAGFTYVLSLVVMLPAMRTSGVSVTGAVVQLSLMLPVAVAVWRFGEYPSAYQTAGIGLTMVALPLLSVTRAAEVEDTKGGINFLTLLLFFSTGISQVVMKEFTAACAPQDLPLYSAVLFAAATVFNVLWLIYSNDPARPGVDPLVAVEGRSLGEWTVGSVLGVMNVLQLLCLLLALRSLPAVIVFPLSAVLGIAANVLASMLLWKERPPAAGWLGMGLAAVAVVLLNLK